MLAILVGVSLLSPWLGRPLTARCSGSATGARSGRRRAGRPELPAQPAAYGGHRQRADDRAGAGGADVDPRPLRRRRAPTPRSGAASRRSSWCPTLVGTPFSTSVADRIRRVDGVRSVAELRTASAEHRQRPGFVGAVDPRDLGLALDGADEGGVAAGAAAGHGRGHRPGGRASRLPAGTDHPADVPGRPRPAPAGGALRELRRRCRPATSSRRTPWSRAGSSRWTPCCS